MRCAIERLRSYAARVRSAVAGAGGRVVFDRRAWIAGRRAGAELKVAGRDRFHVGSGRADRAQAGDLRHVLDHDRPALRRVPGRRPRLAGLRDRYRPEVAAGVSRGRFAAIMGQLTLALRMGIVGVRPRGRADDARSRPGGAGVHRARPAHEHQLRRCVTALPDRSAMVYNVAPGHPLGLVPGNRILGYDGRPWRKLYRELLVDELPVRGNLPSNPSSSEHDLARRAAVNWDPFTTDQHPQARHRNGRTSGSPLDLWVNRAWR